MRIALPRLRRKLSPSRQRTRLYVECLEDRQVLSTIVGLTHDNQLLTFDSASPGTILRAVAITGLFPDEIVGAIDYRPANGMLYAVAGSPSVARLLILDPATGAATQVGPTQGIPQQEEIGLDFNPVVDRLRLVDAEENINVRINPNNAAVIFDTNLSYQLPPNADPDIAGLAYSNNAAGASSTTLFGIDTGNGGLLVTIGSPGGTPLSPSSGQVIPIGPLGLQPSRLVGFDIDFDNTALATLSEDEQSASSLYQINLTNGQATSLGQVGSGYLVRDMAIVPPAVTLSPFSKYVVALYRDVLGRFPELQGFTSWINALDGGILSRNEVAAGFLTSPERQGVVVESFYQQILGRTGRNDPGRNYWIDGLVDGTMDGSSVVIGFVTSDEFTHLYPTTEGYVQAIYRILLDRPSGTTPGEVSFQVRRIDSGLFSRADIALNFLSSLEALTKGVTDYYVTFLRRTPAPSELAGQVATVRTTFAGPIEVGVIFLGSDEYFALVNQ